MYQDSENPQPQSPVSILFQDHGIAELFAQLLESMGVSIRLINEISDLDDDAKIITEPQYFGSLSESGQHNCLLIGQRQSLIGLRAQCITQPLTEEKIVHGLTTFLTSDVQATH